MAKRKYIKAITGRVVAAYPHVHEKDTEGDYPSNKYTITTYLEPDSAEAKQLQELATEAGNAEWPDGLPKGATWPLKMIEADPDKPDKQNVGMLRVVFKSDEEPTLSGADGKPLPEGVKIKGGDVVRIAGAFGAYVHGANKGVTAYLNAVRLIEKRQIDDFGGAEDDYDDEESDGNAEAPAAGKQNYNF